MADALKSVLGAVGNLTKPSYYKESFNSFGKYYYWKYIRAGSFKPVVHLMLLTGTVGYAIEYYALGQHHVAHKKAIVDKALAEHGGHH